MYRYNQMASSFTGYAVWSIIALILAIIGGVLAYFLFIKGNFKLSDNLKKLRNLLDFKVMLIEPILNKKADIVIGTRPIEKIKHFSPVKKMLQKLGSCVMKKVSGADVDDAPSGFRAFSAYAAKHINIFDNYTYTLETIIQAQRKGLSVVCVPIRVNDELRPSRLVKNNFDYIRRSIFTMVRIFIIYRPFRFFSFVGGFVFLLSAILALRFMYFYLTGDGSGHIQSLILCAILAIVSFLCALLAIISDLLAINRKLLEDVQYMIREIKSSK